MSDRTTLMRGHPFPLTGPELHVGDPAPGFWMKQRGTDGLRDVTLDEYAGKTVILSVIYSLETPICETQTKRFNEEAGKLPGVDIITVSMDLPFAQKRWCGAFGVDHVKMLSDHRDGSFGTGFGTLIKELRIESRAIFVVGPDNRILHAEYVREVADFPNYEAALAAAGGAGAAKA